MRVVQEMARIDVVVAHQAEKRGAVASPIVLPELRRGGFVEVKMAADVVAHRPADVRENVRAGVVEGVVEIEKPSAWAGNDLVRQGVLPPVVVLLFPSCCGSLCRRRGW